MAAGLVAGVAVDAALGDPKRGHPVAAFGRAARWAESLIYADSKGRGAAFTAASVLAASLPAAAIARVARRSTIATGAVATMAAWSVIGSRSLSAEASRIQRHLTTGDLAGARAALPSLCGRDPSELDAKGIARAVVESVAENTSDAVVAPLLWGAVGGVPGLVAYRAVNTLDAMVGYHSPRYERFGWASARVDDVANWVPARVTALLTVACAPVAGGSPVAALRAWRRYGSRHPSPNAGRCESAFAGALGVTLGGVNVYHGITESRPELGDGPAPAADDIARAVRLSRAITWASALVAAAVAAR
jgi:adenosylcobinamide-phosphate synthase